MSRPRTGRRAAGLCACVLCALGGPAAAQGASPDDLDEAARNDDAFDVDLPPAAAAGDEVIVVVGEAPAAAASSVHFDRRRLQERPHARPSDLLRQTPGLVVAQHAGGGKADQYFLRGFDADHGTDVAIFVDGIPVNLTSHGHGQGYADTHWVIPETIAAIDVHKGPYAARFGDFYTAGAIEMRTVEPAPGAEVWLTGGTELSGPVAMRRPTARLVGMASPPISGGAAVVAAEVGYTDGPFLAPQGFRRAHLFGKARHRLGGGELRGAATFYAARWRQSGQIPVAEVDAGRLDRFGSLDPTEGGHTRRGSASLGWSKGVATDGAWDLSAYLVDYRMQLFSNFTLYARDPARGDQIEQNDDRLMAGVAATHRRIHAAGGVAGLATVGVQARGDTTVADLWHTAARDRLDTCWETINPCKRARNDIADLAAFVEEALAVGARLRLFGGVRASAFFWRVDDLDPETAGTMATVGGSANAAIVSPKLSAIVAASEELDVFVNTGLGFHSNDARAAVASRGDGALARATGAEVGARLAVGDSLRASFAAWYLHLASEQVWSGDLGGTEPSDPTRRHGLDLDASWQPTPWLGLDANLALGRAAFVASRGTTGALALAPRILGGGGVTVRRGASFGAVRVRGIGDRPANDDASLIAEGYTLVDVVAQHAIGAVTIGLTVENLFDARWREAQFAEESRVTPTAEFLEDVHFTPGAPLTVLVTVSTRR
jgi:outer membrane receptor protein involved in Fe transport